MAKAPAFQFYVKDWLSDPQLKMASHSTKGIWIDMLAFMWDSPERGELTGTKQQLVKMVGATKQDFELFLTEADDLSFCDVCVTDHTKITVRNRRMFRDEKGRKNNRIRQQKFRDKRKDNDEITPASPSPSPSPSPKKVDTSVSMSKCPNQKIIDIYHQKCPSLPIVQNQSEHLKKRLKARWREDTKRQELKWWEWYFENVNDSDYLTGKVNDWAADFDWLIGPKNMTKVLNGRYLNRNDNRFSKITEKNIGIAREWLDEK